MIFHKAVTTASKRATNPSFSHSNLYQTYLIWQRGAKCGAQTQFLAMLKANK